MWIDSLLLPVCISIYISILYILNIYFIYILNQLGFITVKMADKIVMVTIKILSLEKNIEYNEKYTIDNVAAWWKNKRLVVLTRYLHVPKHTHTPKHRPKCTYMEIPVYIFFHTSNCIQRNKRDTHNNNYPHSSPKKQRAKKCYSKIVFDF